MGAPEWVPQILLLFNHLSCASTVSGLLKSRQFGRNLNRPIATLARGSFRPRDNFRIADHPGVMWFESKCRVARFLPRARSNGLLSVRNPDQLREVLMGTHVADYRSFVYSALACLRMGTLGSASFPHGEESSISSAVHHWGAQVWVRSSLAAKHCSPRSVG